MTTNLIAGAVVALVQNPDQKSQWLSDFDIRIEALTEELCRYVSSVTGTKQRIVPNKTSIDGQMIKKGIKLRLCQWQRITILLCSIPQKNCKKHCVLFTKPSQASRFQSLQHMLKSPGIAQLRSWRSLYAKASVFGKTQFNLNFIWLKSMHLRKQMLFYRANENFFHKLIQ